jgi:hypothetical protein
VGQKKFKEFKEFPCCVVMQNNGNISMMVEEPAAVLGGMYAESGSAFRCMLVTARPRKLRVIFQELSTT